MIGCILKMLRQTLFFTIVLFLSNQSDAISRKATPRASNYPLEADLEIVSLYFRSDVRCRYMFEF